MRHPSKLALYLWHSDIGSLGSGVFVASVERGGRRGLCGLSPMLLQTPEANRCHSAVSIAL